MRRVLSVLAICALTVMPYAARADDTNLKARVQDTMNGQCAFRMSGRFDLYADTLDDSFVDVSPSGEKISKKSIIDRMSALQGLVKETTCDTVVKSASAADGKIVTTIFQSVSGTILTKGGWKPMKVWGDAVDTFVERNGALIETLSVDKTNDMIVDGQVVAHEVAPSPSPSP